MTLDELIRELQEWKKDGPGQKEVFIAQDDSDKSLNWVQLENIAPKEYGIVLS